MKRADASGARYALIVGENEAAANRVAVKSLRGEGGQIDLAPDELATHLSSN